MAMEALEVEVEAEVEGEVEGVFEALGEVEEAVVIEGEWRRRNWTEISVLSAVNTAIRRTSVD